VIVDRFLCESISLTDGRPRNSTPAWTQDNLSRSQNPDKKEELTGGRIVVFILGGATMAELRTCYEAATLFKRDVVIGMCCTTPSRQLTN
jgi:hypothetical protein